MKKILLAITLVMAVGAVQAQYGYGGVGYNMGLTSGNMTDYIEQYSWRGFSFEGHGFVSDRISLGGFYSLNTFNDRESGEFVDGTRTLTGTQLRYVNASPISFETRYHAQDIGDAGPYIGLGVGTMWVEQRTLMGIFEVRDTDWQFLLSPHAGYLIPIGYSHAMINLGVRYNAGFESSDLPGQSYFAFNVGLIWF